MLSATFKDQEESKQRSRQPASNNSTLTNIRSICRTHKEQGKHSTSTAQNFSWYPFNAFVLSGRIALNGTIGFNAMHTLINLHFLYI